MERGARREEASAVSYLVGRGVMRVLRDSRVALRGRDVLLLVSAALRGGGATGGRVVLDDRRSFSGCDWDWTCAAPVEAWSSFCWNYTAVGYCKGIDTQIGGLWKSACCIS